MKVTWNGVYPAVTTQFHDDDSLDLKTTAEQIDNLITAGVNGLIMLGTVGENNSLTRDEKLQVLKLAQEVSNGRVPVISGVSEFTTANACSYAKDCEALGIDGLMVLPAMVYNSDARETINHFKTVAKASNLPIMCYNNPVVYGVDISPEMFMEMADCETIVAVKESSDDPRRVTDVFNTCGNRFLVFCGVDDLVMESAALGVVGWVSGLTDAFPQESVRLWKLLSGGKFAEALPLYRWFTPVLHLDTHSKLVQYIKLAQAMTGVGSENVRAPRLKLVGEERERVSKIIQDTIDTRPAT
ncbi:dihydrodipicolinate synthase family protein [Kiloniella antarctica]|uniref:Dihydrodipicolinate synthase family protein n=1 Tax=Kiloniella antarctica TaxID=1550907 RepID=A0ABW5BF57_9PROT